MLLKARGTLNYESLCSRAELLAAGKEHDTTKNKTCVVRMCTSGKFTIRQNSIKSGIKRKFAVNIKIEDKKQQILS